MFPLELHQGSRASSRVSEQTRGSSLLLETRSFLKSYNRGLRAPLKVQQ